jgi:3-hydroxyisobutyrate dehydrogenase
MKNVTFIGLGVMGFPMAGHLQKAGYQVTVYNRTFSKAQTWGIEYGGEIASDVAQSVAEADIVCLCVGRDEDVLEMLNGGVLRGAKKGTIIIDHTTTSEQCAKQASALAETQGMFFIDAPVSGGQAGAENGQLSIMCGAEQTVFEQALPVLNVYGKLVKRIGPNGAGQLAKMMNQIAIAGVIQGLAESLHFGQKAGLDCHSVLEVISQGAAQSWQMQNRGETMLADQYDFGFAVDWMRKDLGYALAAGDQCGATLANTALVDQFYADVQKLGGGRWDTSSLLKRLS